MVSSIDSSDVAHSLVDLSSMTGSSVRLFSCISHNKSEQTNFNFTGTCSTMFGGKKQTNGQAYVTIGVQPEIHRKQKMFDTSLFSHGLRLDCMCALRYEVFTLGTEHRMKEASRAAPFRVSILHPACLTYRHRLDDK